MMFIDELRKCDPTKFIQAPTQKEDPKRQWVSTPIGEFLLEYDRLAKECAYQKQQADFWRQMATGVTPQHWQPHPARKEPWTETP